MRIGCLTALNSFGNPSLIVLYGGVKTALCKEIVILHLSLGPAGTQHLKQNRIAFPASPAHKRICFIPLSSTGACWVWEKEPDDQPLLGSVVCYTAYIFF